MFDNHYHEEIPAEVREVLSKETKSTGKHRLKSCLLARNITSFIPVSYLPRVLPKGYDATVEKACRLIVEMAFESAYGNQEALDLPGNSHELIHDYHVFRNMPQRAVGTCRLDFAVSGIPTEENPPKLLEINCIDYAGTGWGPSSSLAMLEAIPGLEDIVSFRNAREGMAKNMAQLGKKMLFLSAGDNTYLDYTNFAKSMKEAGFEVKHLCDDDFVAMNDEGLVRMSENGIDIKDGQGWSHHDFIYPRCFGTLGEIWDADDVIHAIIDRNVPIYDNLFALVLENKAAHGIFHEHAKTFMSEADRQFAEKVILPSVNLDRKTKNMLLKSPQGKVLKHSDGHMGETVYINDAIIHALPQIKRLKGWTIQDFVSLNTADIEPTYYGAQSRALVDLSVYVSYEFDSKKPAGKRLETCSMSGAICRASPWNYKVNLSTGGLLVPVFFSK